MKLNWPHAGVLVSSSFELHIVAIVTQKPWCFLFSWYISGIFHESDRFLRRHLKQNDHRVSFTAGWTKSCSLLKEKKKVTILWLDRTCGQQSGATLWGTCHSQFIFLIIVQSSPHSVKYFYFMFHNVGLIFQSKCEHLGHSWCVLTFLPFFFKRRLQLKLEDIKLTEPDVK